MFSFFSIKRYDEKQRPNQFVKVLSPSSFYPVGGRTISWKHDQLNALGGPD